MPAKKKENPLTLTQLNEFYLRIIKPDTEVLVYKQLNSLRVEMNENFEDLYKKFEDLQQEYVCANEQLKRIEKQL